MPSEHGETSVFLIDSMGYPLSFMRRLYGGDDAASFRHLCRTHP
jgi:hypothetical protein